MKASLAFTALFGAQSFAFPAALVSKDLPAKELAKITSLAERISVQAQKRQLGLDLINVGFDPNAQKPDLSGDHAYKAPGPNDIRGPCPGLNVLANHGFISRTGVDSAVAITLASNEVFGMGLDLAAFLSVYSAIMAGDLTSVSIGGSPSSGLLGGLTSDLGLLGKPQGLSKSHNRFEADASPTRADLYTSGDADSVNLQIFKQLADMPLGPNGYDLTVLHPFRGHRFNTSISTNGYYWAGPFTHFAVNTATYLFTYNFFRNHSSEHPDGYLDLETLMSFEGVTRNSKGEFEWKAGRERIPDNWYRRAVGDDFGLVAFSRFAVDALLHLPYMAVVGGNTGEPNSFTGVNIADITGGVFNAETLLEGNNLMCLAFRVVSTATPDLLKGLVGNVLLAVKKLTEVLDPVLEELSCPQLMKYDASSFDKFPGAQGGI